MFSHPEFTKKTRTNNNLLGRNLDNNNNFLRPVLSNTSVPLVYNHDHYMVDKYATAFDIERSFIPTRNSGDLIDNNKKTSYSTQMEKNRKINNSDPNNYYNNSSLLMNGSGQGMPVQTRPMGARPGQGMQSYATQNYATQSQAIQGYANQSQTRSVRARPVQESIQNNSFLSFNQFQPPQLRDDLEVNNFLTRNPVNSRRDAMEKLRNTERKSFINDQGGLMNNFVDFNLENTRKDKKEINTANYVPMPRTLAIPKENV